MPATIDYERRNVWVFIFGMALTGIGAYNFSNIWTDKSDLIQLKGTLNNARTYVSMDFAYSHRNPSEHTRYQRAELLFRLKEHRQEFYLTENIWDHLVDDKYEAILKGLKEADSVSVWIRKKDEHVLRPQIFQIDQDNTTLLPFEHLHSKDDITTASLIVIGLFCTLLSFMALLRDRLRNTLCLNREARPMAGS